MSDNPGLAFRKRIRALRLGLDWSQEQLAERAGLNYKHYQEIERGGKTEIRFSTLVRIAQAFGVPLHALFTDDPAVPAAAESPGVYRASRKKPAARKPRPKT